MNIFGKCKEKDCNRKEKCLISEYYQPKSEPYPFVPLYVTSIINGNYYTCTPFIDNKERIGMTKPLDCLSTCLTFYEQGNCTIASTTGCPCNNYKEFKG